MTNRLMAKEEPATGSSRRGLRRIFVRDLEVVGRVGLLAHEIRYEQRIVISIELSVVDDYDGRSDRLSDVLDYAKIVEGVTALVEGEHLYLLETLAERIAVFCLTDPRVASVRVRIEKPDVLPSCKSVGIEIERFRS
jgi:dihydroneopterin aldolase